MSPNNQNTMVAADGSHKSVFSLQLKVTQNYPHIEPSTQKCLVPREQFPRGVMPGQLSFCTINNRDYVCSLYPMNNKFPADFAAADLCVSVRPNSEYKPKSTNILESIRTVEDTVQHFRKLHVQINLNKSAFERQRTINRPTLVQATRSFLSLYSFPVNAVIQLHERAQDFGIQSVEIVSGDCQSTVGCIADDTILCVDNIRYVESSVGLDVPNIAGVGHITDQLSRIAVECSLGERFSKSGLGLSYNALVVGPTGCGKTTVCRHFLRENQCNVFEVQSSDILKPLPGETEEELRTIFGNVKNFVENFEPSGLTVVFIENIDLLCPAEVITSNDKTHIARISAQFVSLLDDLHDSGALVLATTSNLELVNPIIRRAGRFDNEILIHSPSEKQRCAMLSLLIPKYCKLFEEEVDNLAKWVASKTQGFVAADLILLVNNVHREQTKNQHQEGLDKYIDLFTSSLKTIKPTSLRGTEVSVVSSDLTFDNIGGMDALKKSLEVSLLSPIRNPDAFRRFGLQSPKGILLYGPPGCAKTMIAKCLANEANMTFIATSGAEIYSPYVGNAEKFILKIFNTARKNAPCLIFFDEIDALIGSRQTSNSGSDVQTRVLSTLLTEMDGIGAKVQSASMPSDSRILIIGATNRPDVIDNALMRPGRFDRLIHVPSPDKASRLKILEIYKNKMPFAGDVNIEEISLRTENFSGADLCNLCNEAALNAITRSLDADTITAEDFEKTLNEIKPSLTVQQIEWYRNFEKQHVCL